MEWKAKHKSAPAVGIIGLGYVGLPMAIQFARNGCSVTGFDVDEKKTESVNLGKSYIKTIQSEDIAEQVTAGRLVATADFSKVADQDAILICVPTPLDAHREPDLSYVTGTGRSIAAFVRQGQLISLESTTYPGTTEEDLIPILEAGSGLKAGEDFLVVFSPEREDPGNPNFGTRDIPKVIGGLTKECREAGCLLYQRAVKTVVPVSTTRVAEATKLVENIFRSVNIAMVNELKVVFERMGIDIWEVLDAAGTKPFGFMKFEPGPGLGGHCLAGEELVRVRTDEIDSVFELGEIFDLHQSLIPPTKIGDTEIIAPKSLETLSIDPETGAPLWKPVSLLFRRPFEGEMVKVQLSGNKSLHTTDGHPMLVVENDKLVVREAKQLKENDCLPKAEEFLVNQDATQFHPVQQDKIQYEKKMGRFKKLVENQTFSKTTFSFAREFSGSYCCVERVSSSPATQFVYSLEVPDTHTFATTGGIFVHNCIPIDPFYLTWKAREFGVQTKFIELAGEINTAMPKYVITRLMEALSDAGKPLKNSKVMILGLAYKKNVDDPRESPSFVLWDLLLERGADVCYHDPYIPVAPYMRQHPKYAGIESLPLTPENIAGVDAVLIATSHDSIDYVEVVRHAKLVVDTRNACRAVPEEIKAAKLIKA